MELTAIASTATSVSAETLRSQVGSRLLADADAGVPDAVPEGAVKTASKTGPVSTAKTSSKVGGLVARIKDKLTKTTDLLADGDPGVPDAVPAKTVETASKTGAVPTAKTSPIARITDKLMKTKDQVKDMGTKAMDKFTKKPIEPETAVGKSGFLKNLRKNLLPVVAVATALTAGGIAWTKTKDDKDEVVLARKFLENYAQRQKKDN